MNSHIIGIFSDEERLVECIKVFKDKNIKIHEVYMPYPVHEVLHELKRKTRLPLAAFFYGFAAVVGILAFLYYTSVIDWPLNYGGKPSDTLPSFVVITLVLTILSVTILSLLTFSVRAKIFPGKSYRMPDLRAMDDKFVLMVDNAGPETDLKTMLMELGAEEVLIN